MRTYIETTGINEYFIKYIKYHLENCYSMKMQIDCSGSSVNVFEYILSAFKLA